MPVGPPPQAVLDQRWLWKVLIALLGITFLARLIGLDVAGALLSGLMLCFGVILTRDGMHEMAKYALVYAVLCALNFFFDVLPLITELGGRVSKSTTALGTSTNRHGTQETTFKLTAKTTPFFDKSEGLIYNIQSFAMVMSPICMALGVYLSVGAHSEIQRSTPNPDDDFEDVVGGAPAGIVVAGSRAGSEVSSSSNSRPTG